MMKKTKFYSYHARGNIILLLTLLEVNTIQLLTFMEVNTGLY